MRVIGGEFRSRALKTLPGLDVRPTPDRLRETLFNILAPRIEGVVFADIYAGSGSIGIEALSRGAARGIFVEQNRAAANVIRENLRSLGIDPRAELLQSRASIAIPNVVAEIVFLDPPYEAAQEYQKSLAALGERPPALVIVQHFTKLDLLENYGALRRTRVLKQGQNALSFYSHETDGPLARTTP
jgi:16S rRNA (guanine966-N2)-methyltransferase